jgi:membrane protein
MEKNYSYHASAITFSSLLILNTLIIFLGTFLKYIPHKEKLINKIYEIFPNISKQIVDLLVKTLENISAPTQIFTIVLVFFFIANFLRTIEISFSYIAKVKPRPYPIVHFFLPFIFSILMVIYGLFDLGFDLLLGILTKYNLNIPVVLTFLDYIKKFLDFFVMPLGLFVLYYFLSPVKLNVKITLIISLLLFLILKPIKVFFTWYITTFLVKNLVITSLASLLIFLLWLYILFLMLLIGYRAILLLQVIFHNRISK